MFVGFVVRFVVLTTNCSTTPHTSNILMRLQLDSGDATYRIQSYQPHTSICVNDQFYTHSLIVAPHQLQAWSPADFAALTAEDFSMLLTFKPHVILFGSGAHFRFPAPHLLAALYEAGMGVEVMDTAAACRTYSVLMAEARQVLAALLI